MEELMCFLARVRLDHRMGAAHESLFVVLLGMREELGVSGFFPVDREEVMERAKILGKERYYGCLKELAKAGYIGYQPEYYPGKRSKVRVG